MNILDVSACHRWFVVEGDVVDPQGISEIEFNPVVPVKAGAAGWTPRGSFFFLENKENKLSNLIPMPLASLALT